MTTVVYYAEINLIAIIIMILLLRQIRHRDSGEKSDIIVMKHIIISEIIYCLSDFIAAFFRGRLFIGARAIIEVSNLIYMISGMGICYFWLMYVFVKVDEENYTLKLRIIFGIPYLVFVITMFFNPYNSFYFSINNQNLYKRGPGQYLFWAFLIFYGLYATIRCLTAITKAKNPIKKNIYCSTLLFTLPATASCVLQFRFYGITVTQIGIMFSLMLIFLDSEANMVLKDELTGLNNKRALLQYIFSLIDKNNSMRMAVVMVHITNLKEINDLKGRIEGDSALKTAGRVISMSLNYYQKRIPLYRYGSGEFLIINPNMTLSDVVEIQEKVYEGFEKYNETSYKDYRLAVTIETALDDIYSEKDFTNLVLQMYKSLLENDE